MNVLCEEEHTLPLCAVAVVIRTGSASDPVGREGLAYHAAELMRRGAGDRTRAELDAAVEALGASLDLDVLQDSVIFKARCLERSLESLLAILGDVLARPRLDGDEHERLQRETLAVLEELRDDDSALCMRHFERRALPGHPYGRSGLGYEATVRAQSRDDAAAWAAKNVVGDNLIIGFAGDVSPTRAQELAGRAFGGLPGGPAPSPPALPEAPDRPAAPRRRTYLVDKPDRAQSQVLIGHEAPRHGHPDALALQLALTAFGGLFSSRLMTEVRVKRGWSYDASCRLGRARGSSTMRIRVFPAAEQTADTLALVLAEWEELVRGGLRDEEVELARRHLDGSWALELDTPAARLEKRISTHTLDLDADHYPRFRERLAALGTGDVNRAIRRWLWPDDAVTVLTATADTMRPRLDGVGLGQIEVVPFDQD